MRPVTAFLAAAALAGALAVCPHALAQQAGTIIVMDAERIIGQTIAGRDMQQRLQAIAEQMQGELTPEQTSLQQEQQRLTQATQGQTAEQVRANSQLTQQIEAFQRRSQTFSQRQVGLARDLEYTRAQAFQEFQRQTAPIIQEVMQQRGASAALEASIVSRYAPSVDATADIISRIDQRVRTINVTRLSAPPPQQQQAQPQQQQQQTERRRR
jgi:outer membrane protein